MTRGGVGRSHATRRLAGAGRHQRRASDRHRAQEHLISGSQPPEVLERALCEIAAAGPSIRRAD